MTTTFSGDGPILLVDDETQFLSSASLALRMAGHSQVTVASSGEKALEAAEKDSPFLVFLDLTMPGMPGLEVLKAFSERHPAAAVCMLTAHNDVRLAVECMRGGAFDYLVKPLQGGELLACVAKARENRLLRGEVSALKEALLKGAEDPHPAFAGLLTASPEMAGIFGYIRAIAPSAFPILITGETGTGKELAARAIHDCSGRKGRFVCVNAAGIEDALLSDALFGHVRGAFTGADRDRKGLIEEAAEGTLFLDEIGDLRPESQVKLLRLLQEGTYLPVGADRQRASQARIVTATHRDLETLRRQGSFRSDLFYRLQSHEVKLPPLRSRPGDLPLLARHFVAEAARELGRPALHLPEEIFPLLASHAWPGNIRELKGLLADAVSRSRGGVLSLESLRLRLRERRGEPDILSAPASEEAGGPEPEGGAGLCRVSFDGPLPSAGQLELHLIREALRRANNNKTLAADLIGMARQTLLRKLKGEPLF